MLAPGDPVANWQRRSWEHAGRASDLGLRDGTVMLDDRSHCLGNMESVCAMGVPPFRIPERFTDWAAGAEAILDVEVSRITPGFNQWGEPEMLVTVDLLRHLFEPSRPFPTEMRFVLSRAVRVRRLPPAHVRWSEASPPVPLGFRRMLETWPWDGDLEVVKGALAGGRVLAVPTESSYGLAVDPRSLAGVDAIYRIKERERGNPLPVVAADGAQALDLGLEANEALRMAEMHWPAPLTVVAPLLPGASVPAAAGGATLAVRVPAHERLLGLLEALGHPLTATSANRSGEAAICDPAALEPILGDCGAIVVGGEQTPGGPPSTVVSWSSAGLRVLRRGRFDL